MKSSNGQLTLTEFIGGGLPKGLDAMLEDSLSRGRNSCCITEVVYMSSIHDLPG